MSSGVVIPAPRLHFYPRDQLSRLRRGIASTDLDFGNQMAPLVWRGIGPMIASLVLIFSLGALGQFAVAYCRTLLLAYSKVELSQRVCEITGITESVAASDFDRLLQLVRLAPPLADDAAEIRAVRMYHRIASIAGALLSPLSQKASHWVQCELQRCSYFAAVTLDRRLATAAE